MRLAVSGSRRRRLSSDVVGRGFCLLALCLGISFLVLMIGFMWRESALGAHFGINLYHFLVKDPWAPLATPPSYGIVHAVLSTLMVAGLSLVLAVPLGFGIGLFTADIAPSPYSRSCNPPWRCWPAYRRWCMGFSVM
jgi:ABC-type phosphate transport system permease subunit